MPELRLNGEQKKIYEDIYNAYMFAYPLVMTVVYTKFKTNTIAATSERAPINTFAHNSELWDETKTGGANMDTVYSMASLDLKADGIVFRKPETDRFFTAILTDAYGICRAIIGSGGLGGRAAGNYLITGPDFSGNIPEDVTQIKIPTNLASINLRTQIFNADDLCNVHRIQGGTDLVPLSFYKKEYKPPEGVYNPNYEYNYMTVIKSIPIETFFAIYNKYSADNKPSASDLNYLQQFEKYCIGEKNTFTLFEFEHDLSEELQNIPARAGYLLEHFEKEQQKPVRNGWSYMPLNAAKPDADYCSRAYSIHWGPGCNPAEASVYAGTFLDAGGQELNDRHNYVIHIEKDKLPPVKDDGYWSFSVYTNDNALYLIKNEINRYKISSADKLNFNDDGSLDLYLQHSRPKEEYLANWLPIGKDAFKISLRVYIPDEKVIDGTWQPPSIKRMEEKV